MSMLFKNCEIYRTSDLSRIISMLEDNPLKISCDTPILIGSRAARRCLPTFRGIPEAKNVDWDLITTSGWLLEWLNSNKEEVSTIDMIAPLSDDDEQLDLYIYCELTDESKYDFDVPRSSTSYTAYILNNLEQRITLKQYFGFWSESRIPQEIASLKLLLILKKYMLYYSHQWVKTAKDYRELVAVSPPLIDSDMKLCDLFINYNEKIHGKRPTDSNEFTITPSQCSAALLDYYQRLKETNLTNKQTNITIKRDEVFQYTKDQQISLIYQVAMSLSYYNDILIGLEHICTQGPLWLADYAIDNWIDIQQEKFKNKISFVPPSIPVDIDNYRLFPEIPEIVTKQILHYIKDTIDFYSMRLVCKRWYGILREEIFWRDLYTSRFGACVNQTDEVYSWKMLYLIRLEAKYRSDDPRLDQLVNATKELQQFTANDVVKLWEDLTHHDQLIESSLLLKINYILSNSFYCEIQKTSQEYTVRLILIGLEHANSTSKVCLRLHVGEYGNSRFTDYMEQLSIEYNSNSNEQHSFDYFGPALFGFHLAKWGYVSTEKTCLGHDPSTICNLYPWGLLICLFIIMIHPDHRAQHIKYLKNRERRCSRHILS